MLQVALQKDLFRFRERSEQEFLFLSTNLSKNLIAYLYITHYSRTIHGQYTHNKRTILITSVKDRYKFISTFIFNLCNSVKEILGLLIIIAKAVRSLFLVPCSFLQKRLQRYNKILEFPNFSKGKCKKNNYHPFSIVNI